jgi:hypothetical protein
MAATTNPLNTDWYGVSPAWKLTDGIPRGLKPDDTVEIEYRDGSGFVMLAKKVHWPKVLRFRKVGHAKDELLAKKPCFMYGGVTKILAAYDLAQVNQNVPLTSLGRAFADFFDSLDQREPRKHSHGFKPVERQASGIHLNEDLMLAGWPSAGDLGLSLPNAKTLNFGGYPYQEGLRKHAHYFKDVSHLDSIDVYRVLDLFGVTDPCLQHAAKKILVAGGRGSKGFIKDIQEAIDTLQRRVEMDTEDGKEN